MAGRRDHAVAVAGLMIVMAISLADVARAQSQANSGQAGYAAVSTGSAGFASTRTPGASPTSAPGAAAPSTLRIASPGPAASVAAGVPTSVPREALGLPPATNGTARPVAPAQACPQAQPTNSCCGGTCGCNPCTCADCCCKSGPPTFYVRVESLWLQREQPDARGIAQYGIPGPPRTIALSNQDGEFDFAAGPRITVGNRLDCDLMWEISYFGYQHHRSEASVTDATAQLYPADDFNSWITAPSAFWAAEQYSMLETSELHNFEINFRFQVSETFAWLYGARWVNLHESFRATAIDTLPTPGPNDIGRYAVQTDNDLVGFQLGFDWMVPVGERWEIQMVGKVGVMGNVIDSAGYLDDPQSFAARVDFAEHRQRASTLLEVNAQAAYKITPSFIIRGGYTVLWLFDVAAAAEQTSVALNDSGDIFFHGPSAGLECRW